MLNPDQWLNLDRATLKNLLEWSFAFFITINITLFYILFYRDKELNFKNSGSDLPDSYVKVLKNNFELIHNEWIMKTRHSNKRKFNCSSLSLLQEAGIKFVASGWTKSTYKIKLNHQIVTMKTVNTNGHDMSICLQKEVFSWRYCYLVLASKLLQEMVFLQTNSHENIIQVLGYCIPNESSDVAEKYGVTIFEEYGEPVEVIRLLTSSWEDRLKIALGLAKLLQHLSKTTYGSVALNDLRRQQFVLTDGNLKLVDVDDLGLHDPNCNTAECCTKGNETFCVQCIGNVCQGFNEKLNILKAGKHFIQHILPHSAPLHLKTEIHKITYAYQSAEKGVDYILLKTSNLADKFKTAQIESR